jgi:hypothetical protein
MMARFCFIRRIYGEGWDFVPSSAFQASPGPFLPHAIPKLIVSTPLFEEKWDIIFLAFFANIINPIRVHSPGPRAALSSYNHPADTVKEPGIEGYWAQEGFNR